MRALQSEESVYNELDLLVKYREDSNEHSSYRWR